MNKYKLILFIMPFILANSINSMDMKSVILFCTGAAVGGCAGATIFQIYFSKLKNKRPAPTQEDIKRICAEMIAREAQALRTPKKSIADGSSELSIAEETNGQRLRDLEARFEILEKNSATSFFLKEEFEKFKGELKKEIETDLQGWSTKTISKLNIAVEARLQQWQASMRNEILETIERQLPSKGLLGHTPMQ